jgi:hypothetical protein
MTRIFLLTILLVFLQTTATRSAEPAPNDQYLRTFLELKKAAQLERERHLHAAYALYVEVRKQLIIIRDQDNEWVEFNPIIAKVQRKLTELRLHMTEYLHKRNMPEPWRARPDNQSETVTD